MKYLSDIGINKAPENGDLDVAGDIYSNGEKVKFGGGFKVGTISGTTLSSTGDKVISGLGFSPKLVEFELLTLTATNAYRMANGAMDADGNQYSTAIVGTTSGGIASGTSTQASALINLNAGSTTPRFAMRYVSMNTDGFTVSVTEPDEVFTVVYKAYG